MSTALQFVTLGVPSLAQAQALFVDTMGYELESEYVVGQTLAQAWLLPPDLRAQVAEIACNGYPTGRIRLLEANMPQARIIRQDHGEAAPDSPLDVGPKAIDFYVRDPIANALNTLRNAGLPTRSAPVRYQIDGMESEEVLLTGPGHTPILLMVGHTHGSDAMRAAGETGPFSEIATVSVVCGDPRRSTCFYRDVLGLESRIQAYVQDEYQDLVCTLTGAPPGTRMFFQLFGAPGQPSGKVLLVHFEDTHAKRLTQRMRPGNLGFCMMSFAVSDLEEAASKAAALSLEILSGPVATADGRQTMLIRGPNEECVELSSSGV